MLGGPAGKCTGTDCLRLQSGKGPVPVHLIGHHALDIVLQIHHVDDPQVAAVRADILKAAVVLIALEPGLRLLFPARLGHHAQRLAAAVVELVQDLRGLRPGDKDGVLRRAHRLTAQIVCRPVRFASGIVASRAHRVGPVQKHRPAACFTGRVLRIFKVVVFIQLHMPRPQMGPIAGSGIFPGGADIYCTRGSHGDAGLIGPAKRHEIAPVLKIAQLIPGAHRVFQVGREHGAGAIPQPHPQGILHRRVRAGGVQRKKCHNTGKCHNCFFHASSPWYPA